uniref:LAGLIDADG endonuclease n=1 Tax=Phylloporia weberiana TaxID=1001332 RepID=UPI002E797073|nr:LAGLIDADG endonuclease [Ganoderma weberianum]WQH62843.1 LAGLIDADG endonuclease [Ganoderma weberianum]
MCFGKTLNWLKLSNSGDTLKLMIPSYLRKIISGQNNYLGMVTSHKMNENEMGYRGSKSEFVLHTDSVKEQRVDGSYCIKAKSKQMQLRCTLMGFERNYQVKNPTNQLNIKSFSTLSIRGNINPWFITGFTDAEASFIISMYKDDNSKLKWRVTPNFSIHIHIKDIALLESIRDTFGVGKVRKNSSSTAVFRVDNIQELQVIVDHFDKYSLISAKVSDFLLFKQCYYLIKQKQHLTQEGLKKIVALKCNLNKGLTDSIMETFPNIKPVARPHYNFTGIPDPFWISGFVSGDSSFCVSIEKSINQIGRVRLIFGTCLHIRDKALLIGIADYFNILEESKQSAVKSKIINIYDSTKRETSLLQIRNYSDIVNKIIPFFNEYPILGVKRLDFSDFKKVAELIKNKEHLTESGFSQIIKIVEKMNLGRNNF